jgi:hypothetical protein
MTQAARMIFRTSAIALILASLCACGHLPTVVHWPWTRLPPAPSEKADELLVTAGDTSSVVAYPQFWMRNTLILDLRDVSGTGSAVVQPRTGTTWPIRMAIRVRPGQVGTVEVSGDQRVVFPVTNEGMRAVDLELTPGVYTPKTHQVVVRWRPEPTRIVAPAS